MVAGYWILSTVGLHASDSSATFCILLMQRGNLSSDFFEWTQRRTVVPFRRDSVLNLRDRTDGKELLNSPMSKTAQNFFFWVLKILLGSAWDTCLRFEERSESSVSTHQQRPLWSGPLVRISHVIFLSLESSLGNALDSGVLTRFVLNHPGVSSFWALY